MDGIDINIYELPFKLTYRYAKGDFSKRSGLLVRVEKGGKVGWGEASPALYQLRDLDIFLYLQKAKELVDGLDIEEETFLKKLDHRLEKIEETLPKSSLRNGVSTAWLSASAAGSGIPLNRYLCANQCEPAEYIPINGLVVEKTIEGAVMESESHIKKGMTTLKIKCFSDFETDLARIEAIRRAFPNVVLRLDPNGAWNEDVALNLLNRFAKFDIEYIEDALPPDRPVEVFAELREKSPIKLAWDEPAVNVRAVQQLITANAVDVIILKLQRIGGPDLLCQIIQLCERNGIKCVLTSSMETGVGITAILHCASLLRPPIPACGIDMDRFWELDVASAPPIENGWRRVPTAPGLGLDRVIF